MSEKCELFCPELPKCRKILAEAFNSDNSKMNKRGGANIVNEAEILCPGPRLDIVGKLLLASRQFDETYQEQVLRDHAVCVSTLIKAAPATLPRIVQ